MGNRRIEPFNAYRYFSDLVKTNKLLKEHRFKFVRVSGFKALEEVLSQLFDSPAFFALDDSDEAVMFEGNGGFYNRRVFACYLIIKSRINDMNDYENNKQICRRVFQQICSKLIKDSKQLEESFIHLNLNKIRFQEIEEYLLGGAIGFYFIFNVDEPMNLCYCDEEWT